jgi:DNA-binding ferritin-like protein
MKDYYTSTAKKYDDLAIEEEFKKIEEFSTMPSISDISEIADLEEEIIKSAPESLEELAEALNEIVKNTKKKIMH